MHVAVLHTVIAICQFIKRETDEGVIDWVVSLPATGIRPSDIQDPKDCFDKNATEANQNVTY